MSNTPSQQNGATGLKSRRFEDLRQIGQEALVFALRFAATTDGAPDRCRRVSCRRKKYCMLRTDPDDLCPGGLTGETIEKAAFGLVFVHRFIAYFAEGKGAPGGPIGVFTPEAWKRWRREKPWRYPSDELEDDDDDE